MRTVFAIDRPAFAIGLFARILMLAAIAFMAGGVWSPGTVPLPAFGPAETQSVLLKAVTWLTVMPLDYLGGLTGTWLGSVGTARILAVSLVFFAFDLLILALLPLFGGPNRRAIGRYYWLSPVVVVVAYGLGQGHFVPVLGLAACMVLLREKRLLASGVAAGVAIAAEPGMILLLAFLVIYLWRNRRYEIVRNQFMSGLGAALAILLLPSFVLDSGYAAELWTSLGARLFGLNLLILPDTPLFIFPLAYTGLLGFAWQQGRMTIDTIVAVLAAVAIAIVLLTDAPYSWHLWAVPLLALHAETCGVRTKATIWAYWAIIVLSALPDLLSWQVGSGGEVAGLTWLEQYLRFSGNSLASYEGLTKTALIAAGGLACYRLLANALRANDNWRISRRQFAIGIAGDSGAGKTTLADGLESLFGVENTATIQGDDYHNRDRAKSIWHYVTHLDPRANNLGAMTEDTLNLLRWIDIHTPHYDHSTGRFTAPRRIVPRDVVVVAGLHALLTPALRNRYDVSLFLEMDEALRTQLKVDRDTIKRNKLEPDVRASILKRMDDYQRFIVPQRHFADVVFTLEPADPNWLLYHEPGNVPRLRLRAEIKDAPEYQDFARRLIISDLVQVDLEEGSHSAPTVLVIDCSDLDSASIADIAATMLPGVNELIALNPVWQSGATGLMQLITLNEILRRRGSGVS